MLHVGQKQNLHLFSLKEDDVRILTSKTGIMNQTFHFLPFFPIQRREKGQTDLSKKINKRKIWK